MKAALLALLLVQLPLSPAAEGRVERVGEPSPRPSLVGIDHIPVAVGDLEQAAARYRSFGFTLKPGRLHTDGIRNAHVKFPDGSGLELLSPPQKPGDALTADYAARIAGGDGPAFLFLHARDKGKLVAALQGAAIQFERHEFIRLADPGLKFLFFDQDNRSPTDEPEHFVHANSALAMTAVWLALDRDTRKRIARLFLALGAVRNAQTVFVPGATKAEVWRVQNGCIVLLPKSRELQPGRPIVGVDFAVRDFAAARGTLRSAAIAAPADARHDAPPRLFVPPARAHGLWLAFHAQGR